MQKRHAIQIEFGPHVESYWVNDLRSIFGMCGIITEVLNDRTFIVETHRDAHFERLKWLLASWGQKRKGDFRWVEVTDREQTGLV